MDKGRNFLFAMAFQPAPEKCRHMQKWYFMQEKNFSYTIWIIETAAASQKFMWSREHIFINPPQILKVNKKHQLNGRGEHKIIDNVTNS